LSYRRALLGVMAFFFLFWFVIPLVFPFASRPIYLITLPFRYLGVLVHEMGHGLGTLLTGGQFLWFQMDFGQGGVAITAGGWRIATLLGGLLGPALIGGLLLQLSTRIQSPKPVLVGIAFFMLLACYYIVKPVFAVDGQTLQRFGWSVFKLSGLVLPGVCLIGIWYVFRANASIQRLAIQCLGVVMCFAAYSDTRYIFQYASLPNGMFSDSRELAGLFWISAEAVPRWLFWLVAMGISLLNFALLGWGVWRALQVKTPEVSQSISSSFG